MAAAWQVWAVPFFAVIAAPITALNFEAFFARRDAVAGTTGPSVWAVVGRLVLLPVGLLLLVLTWPGWLEEMNHERHRPGWGIKIDPSLQRAAEVLRNWRERGELHDEDRVFAFHPDVAAYCAWTCPEVRHFFLPWYPLGSAAREYEEVVRGLGSGSGENAAKILHEQGVTVVILYDPEPGRLREPLGRLMRDPRHWPVLDIAGRAWVFGWEDARADFAAWPLAFRYLQRLQRGARIGARTGDGEKLNNWLDRSLGDPTIRMNLD